MLRQTLLFAAAIVLLFAGCHKNRDAFVSGTVVDAISGQPIPFANVEIHRYKIDEQANWANRLYMIEKTNTNANGEFIIHYTYDNRYQHAVYADHNSYFNNHDDRVNVYAPGQQANVHVSLYPKSWLRIHATNVNPFSNDDVLWLNYESFYGMTVDTILPVIEKTGNANTTVHWSVLRNMVTSFDSATIYCPAYDTADLQINY